MRVRTPIASLLDDVELVEEIQERVGTDEGFLPRSEAFRVMPGTIRAVVEGRNPPPENFATRPLTEAIVREFGRPALLVKNDTFEVPAADTWKSRLMPNKSKIERVLRSVGRVELLHHPTYDWVGTAWVVGENVVVTNRHVAIEFARRTSGGSARGFAFRRGPDGRMMEAFIDFKEEHRQRAPAFEVEVQKILFIEEMGDESPDLALLQLKSEVALPVPITLSAGAVQGSQLVAVIGYPARDDRNDEDAMLRVFGDIYEVKRLAPGMVMDLDDGDSKIFTHDCSTLGGNSGSLILDINSGEAVGLHFAGQFRSANYAVTARVVRDALRQLRIIVPVPGPREEEEDRAAAEEARRPEEYADREGYLESFLGASSAHKVSLPGLGGNLANAAPLIGDPGEHVLRYTHFSVVMNKERRMAFYTAANIDGSDLRRIPREEAWYLDPRIRQNHQVGNELYRRNDLDRGHLVRRLDPVWGSQAAATEANGDTFHYTNAAPQHKDFNQKTWNDLEDYLLDNAGAHRLRVSVFTGPVFRSDDRTYRSIRLPQQFWKIVAIVRDSDRKLSVTAYLLSQSNLLTDLETGFVFGAFETFQVPVTKVEELTGLDFEPLRRFDPMRPEERRRRAKRIQEGKELNRRGEAARPDDGFDFRRLDTLDDIVL